MQPLPSSFVASLDIAGAVTAEADAWRNLIPPEPWTEAARNNVTGVVDWVTSRLEAGAQNSTVALVNARKSTQGTRPVPIAGVAERVAYRAITSHVLGDITPMNRNAEDYRAFISGPIVHAFEGLGRIRRLGDARLSYVVEADIAAFYQYIDHEVLRRELEMQTGRVAGAGYLHELLGEMQGATYGLPQLLDPSDQLSEMYVRIMERDVVRRGLPTWRFNDDFRIGATSYDTAQDAIEKVADAARRVGLVLNEHKTYISRFLTYMIRYSNVQVDDALREIDPDDVDVAVGDYVIEDDDEAAEMAEATLARMDIARGEDGRMDLKRLSSDDLRELRRAIGSMRRLDNSAALKRLVHLFLFAPSLTPRLTEYLVRMHTVDATEVERIWDALSLDHAAALSEWQSTWLVHAARSLSLLHGHEGRVSYVKSQRLRGVGGLLHAEASLALAEVGEVSFDELDIAIRVEPEPLAPWYVLGIKALAESGAVTAQRVKAVSDSSPLYRLLLES